MSEDTMERLLEEALEIVRGARFLVKCMVWWPGSHPLAGKELEWDERAAALQGRCRDIGVIATNEEPGDGGMGRT